jgi:hypothetical protein
VNGVDSLMEDAVIYEEEDSDEDIEDGDGDYGMFNKRNGSWSVWRGIA